MMILDIGLLFWATLHMVNSGPLSTSETGII